MFRPDMFMIVWLEVCQWRTLLSELLLQGRLQIPLGPRIR